MTSTAQPIRVPPVHLDPDAAEWWRGCVIYQIYPRSFCDSNGDGIGDLPGITSKLDHVASLGVDAIWLSPFFRSPMKDFGYDVSDYCDVDPMFGTLADFDALVARAHELGLRVLIDQVLNHTSDQHPWFRDSRSSRDAAHADWYIWADARPDGTPPNNWLSYFGGPAWQWDTRRRQYYLHNFLASQPDLDFNNLAVCDALLDTVEFWLRRGVDGFRLDTVNVYTQDRELRDNPPWPAQDRDAVRRDGVPASNPYSYQQHIYDKSRPENLAFLRRLRTLLDRYPGTTTVGELSSEEGPRIMAEYTAGKDRLHMAYSFDLLGDEFGAGHVRRVVESMESAIGDGWICWSSSNHDVPRVLTRWGGRDASPGFARMCLALILSLRGSACLYQGEELGLPEADIPHELMQDPYGLRFWPEFKGRDGCRTPMPWLAGPNAGFSTGTPWLPIPAEHAARAVAVQDAAPDSVLATCRRLLSFRKQQLALRRGAIEFVPVAEPALAFVRDAPALRDARSPSGASGRSPSSASGRSILAVFNLADHPTSVVLPAEPGFSRVEPLTGHGFAPAGQSHDPETLSLPAHGVFFGNLPDRKRKE